MRTLLVLGVCGLVLSPLLGADWPGYRGADRMGVSKEKGLLKTWPKDGPKLLWQSDKAGLGYAGMAVVGGIVYTMGARGDDEHILAFDGKGNELWSTKVGPVHDWKGNAWSRGPNCTPTVDGDLVFGLSSKGALVCVNKDKGTEVWRLDLPKQLNAEVNKVGGGIEGFGWGFNWSPLVDGDHLIIAPGGAKGLLAALNKKTGTVVWRSTGVTDPCTYSSPVLATIGGVKQVVYLVQNGLVGVNAKDGALLWQYRRDEDYPDVVCPTPIVRGDMVYASVGYGGGNVGLKIVPDGKKFKAEVAYTKKVIGNKLGGVVLVGDHLYGFHEDANWACQDFRSGTVVWPKKRVRQQPSGSVLAADGRLFVLGEKEGDVLMLAASPKGYQLLGEFKLPRLSTRRKAQGHIWTYPSLSDGKLYLRDQELLYCYQVK